MTIMPPMPTPMPTAAPSMACPRCRQPMRLLALSSHRQDRAQLSVEHCDDCRSVWFDALESVQLDAAGWVRLLRAMELATARPSSLALAQPGVARPGCPHCAAPLQAVHNRSRWGRFAVLECPARHGHLHGHSGLLAERGLVRPLGVAERRALAEEKRELHCLNCGGPANARDDECRWCRTPLVVLDLPRLAHSLLPREASMAASPREQGRHTAWPCRGCGAALDPGRDTACRQCGHLVVAHELPDLQGLLDTAEAALGEAGAVLARVRNRFPSSHRERPAQANEPRPDIAPAWQRRLLLGGWLPLWALLATALLTLAGVVADWHGFRSSPIEALRLQPVGRDPGAGWGWIEAQRLLQPDDGAAQRALREGLLELVLRQRSGEKWPLAATVGGLIDGDALPGASRGRWEGLLAAALQPLPASIDEPLPAAAVEGNDRLSLAAPGLWVESERRSRGVWRLTLRHAGADVLPVRALKVEARPAAGAERVPWSCQPLQPAPKLLRPTQTLALLCRTTVAPAWQAAAWQALAYRLQDGQPPVLAFEDGASNRSRASDEFIDANVAEAAAASVALDRFLRNHTTLRDGRPRLAGAFVEPPALPWAQRWQQLPTPRRAALVGAATAAAFVLFCVLARRLGERRGGFVWWLLTLPPVVWAGGGQGPASVLLVGMYGALTVLLAFAFAFGYRVYRQRIFRRFAPR